MSTGNYNASTKDDRKQNVNGETDEVVTRHVDGYLDNSNYETEEEFASPYSNAAGSRQSYKEAMNTPLSDGMGGSGVGFGEMPAPSTCAEGVSPMAIYNEERMKRKLQFYFMNPIEKWQARRKFPYKFVVQVICIINW